MIDQVKEKKKSNQKSRIKNQKSKKSKIKNKSERNEMM